MVQFILALLVAFTTFFLYKLISGIISELKLKKHNSIGDVIKSEFTETIDEIKDDSKDIIDDVKYRAKRVSEEFEDVKEAAREVIKQSADVIEATKSNTVRKGRKKGSKKKEE